MKYEQVCSYDTMINLNSPATIEQMKQELQMCWRCTAQRLWCVEHIGGSMREFQHVGIAVCRNCSV